MNAGKLIIVGIFGVSLFLGVFAWWYRYEQGNEALAFWGTDHAVRIGDAATVELLVLAADSPGPQQTTAAVGGDPPNPSHEVVEIGTKRWNIVQRHDISRARGFSHLRLTLVRDVSFLWDEQRGSCPETWQYALRFTDAGQTSLVAFDFACHRIRLVGTERETSIRPDLSDNLRQWVERQGS